MPGPDGWEKEPQEEPGTDAQGHRRSKRWATASSAASMEANMDVPEIPAFHTPPPPSLAPPRRTVARKTFHSSSPDGELRRTIEALGESLTKALGESLCCKIEQMERSLERSLEAAVERTFGCRGSSSDTAQVEQIERTLERSLEAAVERTFGRRAANIEASVQDTPRCSGGQQQETGGTGGVGGAGSVGGAGVAGGAASEPEVLQMSVPAFRRRAPPSLTTPENSTAVEDHSAAIESFRFDTANLLPEFALRSPLGAESELPPVSSRPTQKNNLLRPPEARQPQPQPVPRTPTQEDDEFPTMEPGMEAKNSRLKVDIRVCFKEIESRGIDACGNLQELARDGMQTPRFNNELSVVTPEKSRKPCLQSLVMHPTSNPILVWHTIGPVLLAYDIIMIPMQAFPLYGNEAMQIITAVTTTYWSFDAVRAFFTGFDTELGVEMRPREIANRYIRSWFVLDFMTCIVDWTMLIGGNLGTFNKFWRTGRAMQAWRVLRLVRLVRVLKFARRIGSFAADRITSVQALITIKSLYVAFAVAMACHYMACYWYFVGGLELEPFSKSSWLIEHGLTNATVLDAYVSSFHWAIAQSGFAPTEVYPTNTLERIYASCVSFCWLIIVSVTINLFSIWLSHLHEANKDQESQNIRLRKFLDEHDVSRRLTYRVLRCFRARYRAHRKRVHEEDIDFLRDLPASLKISLRREVFLPVLKRHPFFAFIGKFNPTLLLMISYCAMREDRFLAGEVVFVENTPARRMLYVQIGRLDYYAVQSSMCVTKLEAGDWACEAALWMHWTCRGRLVTESTSELVSVDVERFMAIMHYAKAKGEDFESVKDFARSVCERFVVTCPNSDLWWCTTEMHELAEELTCSATSSRSSCVY